MSHLSHSLLLFALLFPSRLLLAADRPLTLRDALSRVLLKSPELSGFPYEERAANARILQAGLRPNPEMSFRVEDFSGTKDAQMVRDSETTLELSQLFELGGKREARVHEAGAAKALLRFDYEAKRSDILVQTAQNFYDVLGAQGRVALAQEALALSAQTAPEIRKRLEAGLGSAIEQARNDAVVASARIALEQAQGELAAARRHLASRWKARSPDFAAAAGNLDGIKALLPFTKYAVGLRANPSVARWEVEVEKRRAVAVRLEAEGRPDLTVAAGPRYLKAEDALAFVAGVSIPLPFHNKNEGAVREAQALVQKAAFERSAAETALLAELGDNYERMKQASAEVVLLDSTVLPSAQQALLAVNDAYSAGRLGQLDLLEARRSITAARLQRLQALVAYRKAAAELEGLTGGNLLLPPK